MCVCVGEGEVCVCACVCVCMDEYEHIITHARMQAFSTLHFITLLYN